jgi:Holliday junction resolvasome RuvABC DNA-binding subunit
MKPLIQLIQRSDALHLIKIDGVGNNPAHANIMDKLKKTTWRYPNNLMPCLTKTL